MTTATSTSSSTVRSRPVISQSIQTNRSSAEATPLSYRRRLTAKSIRKLDDMHAAIFLLVSGVFNFIVWPPFYRRTAADPRAHDEHGKATRFLRVHAILIG